MADLFGHSGFKNPYMPGAGHMPPYLAGRDEEQEEFSKYLEQDVILKNLILTGLRGVGKTVLLRTLRPIATEKRWLWVGADISEAASLREQNIATRLITDLAVITSSLVVDEQILPRIGFDRSTKTNIQVKLDFQLLVRIFESTPGLVADKLKMVLEYAWISLSTTNTRGVVFAYDEAQNLSDNAEKEEYPLSLLLDVFQSLQRKEIPFMLVLTGLPTLFAKLVEARTYSERMFHILELGKLNERESRAAILVPIQKEDCPVKLTEESVELVVRTSGGYPYFIQYICREVYDVFIQRVSAREDMSVPIDDIIRKLDTDFFSGRWSKATDRQRELLSVIANLDCEEGEFTAIEASEASRKQLTKGFSPSHTTQMIAALCNLGLVYKNRRGKYSFAVPLLHEFIKRQSPGDNRN